MISNYIGRLLLRNLDSFKCNVYNMSQIFNVPSKEALGKRMKVQGWVRSVRKMKGIIFMDVSDGLTPNVLQVVIPKSDKLAKISYGCSVTAEGELVLAPNGSSELHASNVTVIGECDVMDGYPFAPRKTYVDTYIRQYLHFRPRTKTFSSILRLRDLMSQGVGSYFKDRAFINVHTPVLTSNDCEGAGELFLVKPYSADIIKSMKRDGVSEEETYFNATTFLTVSGQLHLEVVARALTRVYTFGPTFRAENSKSRLHLSEFYMVEAEIAFIDSLDDLMDEVELLIKYITRDVLERGACDMNVLGIQEPMWLNQKFTRITYDDAVKILESNHEKLNIPVTYGEPFTKEQELFLVEQNNNIPIFVMNWPKERKPFYMKECKDDASKVAAMDLLVPLVGELVGGSLREDDYKKLQSKLPTTSDLSWYLELRKHGNVPTGGFGLGFERLMQCVLGISNIKDTLPFPRWPHNCNL
ncbi:asparagine--tRNA ligase, mitochondrial [Megalopta genalis]|uniref:asparagine--tRNA ligase, mitochondrial n=1 Tax=Megalopta genalis TaxID=115081 RepID=UPI003FCF6F69